jgi:hypothetical protein
LRNLLARDVEIFNDKLYADCDFKSILKELSIHVSISYHPFMKCPLCAVRTPLFRVVESVNYFECATCEFIFADPDLLDSIDSGKPLRVYDSSYWQAELASARERAFGGSLARAAEAVLYTRRPIESFLDVCCGPGYLLDALQLYLPQAASRFFGVELYPPPPQFRTTHPNYTVGELGSLAPRKFQSGVCVEVLEHLTPKMARNLAADLASISDPDGLYIFNTGLVSFVKKEEPSYLDPFRRGHITVWSVPAARQVFEPAGFSVMPIPGKAWAFAVQFGNVRSGEDIRDRIWTAPPENKALLTDPATGTVMYILGRESARAYG